MDSLTFGYDLPRGTTSFSQWGFHFYIIICVSTLFLPRFVSVSITPPSFSTAVAWSPFNTSGTGAFDFSPRSPPIVVNARP